MFAVRGNLERLAIIDFADASIYDPSIDFAELAIDLSDEGFQLDRILEMILNHYQTDDPAIADKIQFHLLAHKVKRAYQRARRSLK